MKTTLLYHLHNHAVVCRRVGSGGLAGSAAASLIKRCRRLRSSSRNGLRGNVLTHIIGDATCLYLDMSNKCGGVAANSINSCVSFLFTTGFLFAHQESSHKGSSNVDNALVKYLKVCSRW